MDSGVDEDDAYCAEALLLGVENVNGLRVEFVEVRKVESEFSEFESIKDSSSSDFAGLVDGAAAAAAVVFVVSAVSGLREKLRPRLGSCPEYHTTSLKSDHRSSSRSNAF